MQMITAADYRANRCTFQWKIENAVHWWWLGKTEGIRSPVFIADSLEKSKWSLSLHPVHFKRNYITLYLHRESDCNGPDEVKVNFQITFLGKDGSIWREKAVKNYEFTKENQKFKIHWGFQKFQHMGRDFETEREILFPENALTIQCILWIKDQIRNSNLFATSTLKVKNRFFVWRIDNVSTLKSNIENKFRDYLIDCDLLLCRESDSLIIQVLFLDDSIEYLSCNISIIDSEKEIENFGIQKYFADECKKFPLKIKFQLESERWWKNESRYFPNDALSLYFELVLQKTKHSESVKVSDGFKNEIIGNEQSESTASFTVSISLIFNDATTSDMEIRTHAKTFRVHKIILSSRSPVFKRMFCHNMEEINCGYVEITDFDDDTIHDMLLYIYSDSLWNLQIKKAFELYKIADKYEILCLKSKCSDFLRNNLSIENACDYLVIADVYYDDRLKRAVERYILRHRKQIFFSQEWEVLMRNNLKLAACVMYKKLTKRGLYLP